MRVLGVSFIPNRTKYDGNEDFGLFSVISNISPMYTKKIVIVHDSASCEKEIIDYKPDVIVTSVYSWYPCVDNDIANLDLFKEMGESLLNLNHKPILIAGGYPISYYAKEALERFDFLDYVILFEGEKILNELLRGIELHVEVDCILGVAYRKDNSIAIKKQDNNADLDKIEFPDRSIIHGIKNQIAASIASTRGCKRNCSFCIVGDYWGECKSVNVIKLVDEIEKMNVEYGIEQFNFVDASFEDGDRGINKLLVFAKEIKARKIRITYYYQLRAETVLMLQKDELDYLIESGLGGISVGIETFNEADRKLYGKYASIETNLLCLEHLRKSKLPYGFNIINFNPYTSWNELIINADFLYKTSYMFDLKKICTFCQIIKNTKLYEKVKNDGLLLQDSFMNFNKFQYVHDGVYEFSLIIKKLSLYKEINVIHYFGHEFTFYISYICRKLSEQTILEEILAYCSEIKISLQVLNEFNYRWYKNILIKMQQGEVDFVKKKVENWHKEKEVRDCISILGKMKEKIVWCIIRYDKSLLQ